MASSKRLRPDDLAAHVASILQRHPRGRVALALSGGLDSVVLFHLLLSLRDSLGFGFSAFHVHHGLSPRADRWEAFCASLCARNGVPFETCRVAVSPCAGESLEAAAREARYRAFASCSADLLLLAQHQDDQAETLLLQLLRGAGAKGLAAMPETRMAEGKTLLRPLLDVPRETLKEYVQAHGLVWEEDESNADTGFDRNFLRHEIFPVLERRFPSYRQTLGRSSRHLAEAAQLLDELARLDGERGIREGLLDGALLRELSPSRAKNLLRYYLAQCQIPFPDTPRMEEAMRQLREAGADAQVRIRFGDYEIRRYRGWVEAARSFPALPKDLSIFWSGETELALPGAHLRFEQRKGEGIRLDAFSSQPVTLRSRHGGERFRPSCGRSSRSLKNLLQEAGIPPWQRAALPLLFVGDNLVWVPGIGIDCDYQAGAEETGWVIHVSYPA